MFQYEPPHQDGDTEPVYPGDNETAAVHATARRVLDHLRASASLMRTIDEIMVENPSARLDGVRNVFGQIDALHLRAAQQLQRVLRS